MSRAFFTFPGTNGNYISTPATPDLDITASVALTAQVRLDGAASANVAVIGTRTADTGYQLAIDTTPETFSRHGTGTTDRLSGSAPLAVIPDKVSVIQSRFDATAGDWLHTIDSVDQAAPLGDTDAASPSGLELGVGAAPGGGSLPFFGDIMYAQVVDGYLPIGPVALMNANEAGFASGPVANGATWVGSDGRTWTVNGAGIIYTPALGGFTGDLLIIRKNRYGVRTLTYGGLRAPLAIIRSGRTI